MNKGQNSAFFMGIAAVVIWAMGATFTRGLTEEAGVWMGGVLTSLPGGLLMLAYKAKKFGLKGMRETPKTYWLTCGLSFVTFAAIVNLSIGLAYTREQVVTSGLFRLIWPLLALILTIPLHKKRVAKWFIFSVSLSFIGVILGNFTDGFSLSDFIHSFGDIWLVSLLSLISSVLWALYTNCLGRYVKTPKDDHLWLLMLTTGVMQLILGLIFGERLWFIWNATFIGGLVYMGIAVSFFANLCWVRAMASKRRHANILISNLTPLIATVFVGLTLGVQLTWQLILGAALVTVGTIWSKYCFLPDETAQEEMLT